MKLIQLSDICALANGLLLDNSADIKDKRLKMKEQRLKIRDQRPTHHDRSEHEEDGGHNGEDEPRADHRAHYRH